MYDTYLSHYYINKSISDPQLVNCNYVFESSRVGFFDPTLPRVPCQEVYPKLLPVVVFCIQDAYSSRGFALDRTWIPFNE